MAPSTTLCFTLFSLLGTRALALGKEASTTQPRPYTINVDPSFIEETRLKASKFRPSVDIRAPAWSDGPPSANVTALGKFWAEEYDWSAEQARINSNFSHYFTTLPPPGGKYTDALDLHFIHQRSQRKDAIPLLMLHGWPSTSLEWEKVIPGLVDPEDDSKPAFHIIAPDLPGYGFSPAPKAPGLGPSEHGTVFASLMEQLGYDRYALYSTDLGFVVAIRMVEEHTAHIINHVTDFYLVFATDEDNARYAANKTTPEESAYISSINGFFSSHAGYSAIHSTLPLSLADALNDSPVGFLAWMWQLVFTVSDQAYTPTELITRAFLLYLPGVYGNIRSYKELYSPAYFAPSKPSTVPTSALQFGGVNGYPELANFNYVVSSILHSLPQISTNSSAASRVD
ncbi:alpha/beta-hydrolase [Byssothecium circinans]|uniref:Alpha/beta-hydrolase n=1 Tax=Byssothecium circinans TaxID=147558 RepID=A0A6A5TZ49_9PLEO|nr:alpha/beta-hydrolase [Byssothecium circinans]